MKTSPDNRYLIDGLMTGDLHTEDRLLLEARALTDRALAERLHGVEQTAALVKQYGRKQLRQELDSLHKELFATSPCRAFARRIRAFFA